MRRATMAGAAPASSLPTGGGRATLAEDPRKRQRNVRDRGYQMQCINGILDFLAAKEYDRPISVETLANPSLKDFQSIFKFVYAHIDEAGEFSRRFEEEVIAFLRGVKYPHASEINRSQLVAITPHTWPTLLAMLAWLVALAQAVEEAERACAGEPSVEEESRRIFYHYLYSEYAAYMEGRDENSTGEKNVERAIAEINEEQLKKSQECQSALDKIKREISAADAGIREVQELEEKKEQTQADIEKLAGLKKHNEVRQKVCAGAGRGARRAGPGAGGGGQSAQKKGRAGGGDKDAAHQAGGRGGNDRGERRAAQRHRGAEKGQNGADQRDRKPGQRNEGRSGGGREAAV